MSLALNKLDIVQYLEARTKVYSRKPYGILRGGSQTSWKPVISTSYSNTSITFTAPPPNPKIFVDRKVLFNIPLLVTLNGSLPIGQTIFQAGKQAPRAHPIPMITTTAQCTLNNTSVSINTNDVIDAFFHYWDPVKKREIDDSLSPSMLDQSQEYSDLNGSIRNPLNSYLSSVSGADTARGAFNFQVLTNTNLQATILLNVTDFIYLPPFLSDQEDSEAFIGIQTMDFNFTMGSLERCMSIDNVSGPAISSVTAVINSNPQLFFNYITPNPIIAVPESVIYPYFEIQRFSSNVGILAPNVAKTISTNNIQLKSIPQRMYLLARRSNIDRTPFTTDTYGYISNVTIDWNNRTGLLSSARPQDLFKMCVANGLQLSWTQFSQWVGSPLCVVFGKDISVEPNEVPGILGTYQLQLSATVQNLNQDNSVNYDFYVITVSEGVITIENNRSITQIGVVSAEDVLHSLNAPMIDYNEVMHMRGASFWGNIKDFFVKAYHGAKDVYDKVSPYVVPVVKGVLEAKKLLGYGAHSGGVSSGGSYSGGVANDWTDYVSKHAGLGISKHQLSINYRKEHGLSPKTKAKAKKAKAKKAKAKKPCATGKIKRRVSRCMPKKLKGKALYEGGDMMDRDSMSQYMNEYR